MKKSVYLIFLLGIGMFPHSVFAQEKIQWMDFSTLDDSLQLNPKKVLISFYTDWCTYCRKMEKEVYTDPEIIQKINASYYAVRMDAESTDSIHFDGQWFYNRQATKRRKGFHELALLLGARNGKMTLPVTLFLEADFHVREAKYVYLDRKAMKKLL